MNVNLILFGLFVVLLILNVFWKRRLMKEEQGLIGQGKEAAA